MVSSRSLSEVVSSQGRFIAAKKKEQLRTPSQTHRAPRCPPPSLPARLLQAPLPRRRGRLLETLSHAAARAGLATPPSAGGAPPPLRVPSLATLQAPPLWDGVAFYWLIRGGRTHAGQWPPKSVGRGVGTGPAHLGAGSGALAVTCRGGSGRRPGEHSGRGCRARTPGVWTLLCKPQSLPPSFYPRFKE